MSDQLYRERLLEHWREPHHFGTLENATHHAEKSNPLCGDEIAVTLRVEQHAIVDIAFTGRGCAVSVGTMSMLAEKVKGMHIRDVQNIGRADVVTLLGVEPSPTRLKCAMLGLDTILASL
jgi:nitrogen fixation protein NifU and related proteins